MTSEASKPSWFYWLTGGIVIFLLTLLDQGSKLLAVTYLKNKDDIILLPGVLQLKYLENRGMAFGMFEGKIPVFVILCFVFLGVFIYVYRRIPKTSYYLPLTVTSLFMVSGAVGNCIDRVFRGYVVDFVYFPLLTFRFSMWRIFLSYAVGFLWFYSYVSNTKTTTITSFFAADFHSNTILNTLRNTNKYGNS